MDSSNPFEEGQDPKDLPPARDAATLVLLRERAEGPPEYLMMRRAQSMEFAGGALVFPGGAVDADDHAHARQIELGALNVAEAAVRICAIRETLEEAGVLIGAGNVATAVTAEMRQALNAGTPFSQLCRHAGVVLDVTMLVPFARWLPNFRSHRRYDTRFYACAASTLADRASVDDSENEALFWGTAAQFLQLADAGSEAIIFPTRRNLERLAQFDAFDALLADAERHPVQTITPWVEERNGEKFLVLPKNAGYPITEEPMGRVRRG